MNTGLGSRPASSAIPGTSRAAGGRAKASMTPRAAPSGGSSFAAALGSPRPDPAANAPAAAQHSGPGERRVASSVEEDPLDPSARCAAQLAPPTVIAATHGAPPFAATAPVPPVTANARVSLEELLPALVRRIAWAGDGRRGSVRLELGAGALAGATVIVHAELGRVRVELVAPKGVDAEPFRARVAARLAARGIDVEQVEVVG